MPMYTLRIADPLPVVAPRGEQTRDAAAVIAQVRWALGEAPAKINTNLDARKFDVRR